MDVTVLEWAQPRGLRYRWHRLRRHYLTKEMVPTGLSWCVFQRWRCNTCQRIL